MWLAKRLVLLVNMKGLRAATLSPGTCKTALKMYVNKPSRRLIYDHIFISRATSKRFNS